MPNVFQLYTATLVKSIMCTARALGVYSSGSSQNATFNSSQNATLNRISDTFIVNSVH